MIGTIEQAMIDRMKTLSDGGHLGYRLRQIETYGGQFDEGAKEVARDYPLVFFAWTAEWAPPLALGNDVWQYRPAFAAIVATRNLRNESDTRHGGAGDVGSYQMLIDIRAAFVGHTLGLDIVPFTPGPARTLFNDKIDDDRMSVLACELRTEFAGEALIETEPGDFATFHADWDLPPHETHDEIPLPDGEADAEDTVQLETE